MRTDVHAPRNLVPKDYEFVGFLVFRPEEEVYYEVCEYWREVVKSHMMATGGTWSKHDHGGSCEVCGNARAIYKVVFYHRPTNTYIRVGRECAEKISEQAALGLEEFTQSIRGEGLRRKRLLEAEIWLKNAGLEEAWNIFKMLKENHQIQDPALRKTYSKHHYTVYGIVKNLIQYGYLTERQEKYLRLLIAKIFNPPEEKKDVPPVTNGEQKIKGKIIGIKKDEIYGTIKIMVESENGQKFWGTFPKSKFINNDEELVIEQPKYGMEIEFIANVTVSKNDSSIGFYKRPKRGYIISF
ncbi:MAG: hypothetical protein N3A54_01105 [Patescibacteria group bacterium]|nr:hypothetical protein [Patescibacteria group bacterium]